MKNVQWMADDFVVIWPVIGGLLALIAGGVVVAEKAIIDLTGYTRQVEFINLQLSGTGAYTFYLLGESITLQSLINIGKICSLDRKIFLEIGGVAFSINTCPAYDARILFGWLGIAVIAVQQGLAELFSFAAKGVGAGGALLVDYLRDFLRG